jgi:uncharacterized protein
MAPTVLSPGDIAIIGYITNGSPDSFSFVPLVPIATGTVIYFTDNGWTGVGFRGSSATDGDGNENLIRFSANADIPAGTVIRSVDISANFTWATSGVIGTTTAGSYNNLSLSQSGEQIAAFQSANLSTPLNSEFIGIVQIDNTGAFENADSSSTGGVVPGLSQAGNTAVLFNNLATYAAFNTATLASGTREEWLAAINNSANWTFGSLSALPAANIAVGSGSSTLIVDLSVSASAGAESAQTVITVTATSSGAVAGEQTVSLNVSGTGIAADDYALSNNVIAIPDGGTSGSITFMIADDALVEGAETAVISISNPSSGIQLGSATTQNIAIADNESPALPSVNISSTDTTAVESGATVNTATFTITRTGDTTAALTVAYAVAGTATNGNDYNSLTGSVLIPAGQTSATISVTPVNDGNAEEGNETISLTLVDGETYDLGAIPAATVMIADNTTGALKKVGGSTSANGAEIPAFDPGSDRLFTVAGNTVEIYTVSATGALTAAGSLATGFTPPSGTAAIPNSVAVKNGTVAVAYAIQNTTTNAQELGQVSFYNAADGAFLKSVTVGYLPDMLTFTPDGTKVLTANEGEPNSYGQANSFDPEGSVSIIDLSNGVMNATVQTADFTAFNSQADSLEAAGVRITGPGSTVDQDLEPEYIAFSGDGTKAYVTLQENNALAIVDIATSTITEIKPLGAKDYSLSGNGIDPSDQDGGINIRNVPVFGLYQPDAIASYTVNGQTYYITANEGDSRSYTGFSEEVRVGSSSYVLDPTVFPDAATLKQNTNLGRLQLTNASGDTDGDGDFDRIESFGARSFSIWDSNGQQVFDSGNQFEQITATQVPSFFNSDGSFTASNFDTRSDNKGPEPEGVTIGVVNNRTFAFIGLERTGDVIVYEVTNPTKPQFIEYINTPEDVGPEGLTFILAADSPTGKPLLVTTSEVSKSVAVFEFTPPIRISDIQGASHLSPLNGQTVINVPGIVTAVAARGFYLQDPNADRDDRTSEGIFVFTSSAPTVQVGDSIQVSGTVTEFRPGGSTSSNLTTTEITSPTVNVLSQGNALPDAAILGNGGRAIPTTVIEDDTTGNIETSGTNSFDPSQDGIDFFESLEGMRVQIDNPVATSPTNSFGEIFVLADDGENATGLTARGGSLISPGDFNPERIQIDDTLSSANPSVDVGAKLSPIIGVVDYNFNNYEVLPTTAPTVLQPSSLLKEATSLTGEPNRLTVSTFNVENLDAADDPAKFTALADRVVNNLKSPDILTLEEIQDNNGPISDGTVNADQTYRLLIDAIAAAGGPTYEYRQIDPTNNQDGGEPGGNIRQGFLYNPDRVQFVDRPGGGSLANTSVSQIDGKPQLSASPGRIDPVNTAFDTSRKPLVGEFLFNGQTVFLVANHFNSKGGDQPLYGPTQPPALTSEVQRSQQAEVVKDFVQDIFAIDPNANVIVLGDLNDFEFSGPLDILKSAGLTPLVETLPENERYTYNFQGNAQTLDHILVSSNLLNNLDGYDIVHINSEFADQVSDHDPSVARFRFNSAPTDIALSATTTDENVAANTAIGSFSSTDPDLGNTFTYSLVSGDGSTDNAVFSIAGKQLQLISSPDFEAKASYRVRVRTTDQDGLSFEESFEIGVNNLNESPVAKDDRVISVRGATTILGSTLLANDTDPDTGATLAITAANDAIGGTATLNNGSIVFTPNVGFSGDASFIYIVSDGSLTDTATVTVVVGKTLNGGNGNDTLEGNDGDDVLNGGNGNDRLLGFDGDDVLGGGNGNDELLGDRGDDILNGGNGIDRIFGGDGADFLNGENGDDLLAGGAGSDRLTGGNGKDTFQFALGDSLFGNFDRITDFRIGLDTIDGPNTGKVLNLGRVQALDVSSITNVLGSLSVNGAATFGFGFRTFLALNDGTAGFSEGTDTIVEITGFSGRLNQLVIA